MFGSSNPRPFTSQLLLRGGFAVDQLTGTKTLDDQSAQVQLIATGGVDRDVVMPASNREGVAFLIVNTGGAGNIFPKTPLGGSVDGFGPGSAVSWIAPGSAAIVTNIGGTWGHCGVFAITI